MWRRWRRCASADTPFLSLPAHGDGVAVPCPNCWGAQHPPSPTAGAHALECKRLQVDMKRVEGEANPATPMPAYGAKGGRGNKAVPPEGGTFSEKQVWCLSQGTHECAPTRARQPRRCRVPTRLVPTHPPHDAPHRARTGQDGLSRRQGLRSPCFLHGIHTYRAFRRARCPTSPRKVTVVTVVVGRL